jgi:hypothetical protein
MEAAIDNLSPLVESRTAVQPDFYNIFCRRSSTGMDG